MQGASTLPCTRLDPCKALVCLSEENGSHGHPHVRANMPGLNSKAPRPPAPARMRRGALRRPRGGACSAPHLLSFLPQPSVSKCPGLACLQETGNERDPVWAAWSLAGLVLLGRGRCSSRLFLCHPPPGASCASSLGVGGACCLLYWEPFLGWGCWVAPLASLCWGRFTSPRDPLRQGYGSPMLAL